MKFRFRKATTPEHQEVAARGTMCVCAVMVTETKIRQHLV